MKIIGIITEYNPFHNGHAYQITEIRKRTGADYVVVAMSGNFVQRGTPAIIDKYARTKMALSCGADLVFELPTLWATSSAESFAMAGVTLFDHTGCIDEICFGAETDYLPLLTEIALLLVEEPQEYRHALSHFLKEGFPFPAARAKALCAYLANHSQATKLQMVYNMNDISSILSEPNNILAIEYLKAIHRRKSKLSPHLIKREGAGYHDTHIPKTLPPQKDDTCASPSSYHAPCTSPTASATAIRNVLASLSPSISSTSTNNYIKNETHLSSSSLTALSPVMPTPAYNILTEYLYDTPALLADDFSSILSYLLLSQKKENIIKIADSNEEITNRLIKNRYYFSSFSSFCSLNKSRDITYTRISRILLHLLLNITNADYLLGKKLDYIPYLRILGFRRASSALLTELKKTASVPVISKLADAPVALSDKAFYMLKKDIFAADLYDQVLSQKAKKTTSRSEYTRKIVLL